MAHILLGCGECQERPFHSKIRVCSAPPWKATPVTLSCITTGKEPNRTSHTDDFPVPLNSEPFYRLTPALWDMQLLRQQPFSLMQCFRSNLLEKKTNRKGNPPIFCHTLHWAFFFTQQQLCYIKQWELQGQLMNFLSVLPVYCTVPSWCSCISTFSYSTEFLMKK